MKSEEMGNWTEVVGEPVLPLNLHGKKWRYRGEGNANLVIALPEEGFILRLHKWERGKEVTAQAEKEEEQRGWRETVFCRSVMVPLLGSAYIQPPVPARIDQTELDRLDQALKPYRPAFRNHKGIKFGHVTIYPDYALLPLNLKKIAQDFDNMNFTSETKVLSTSLRDIENSTDSLQERTKTYDTLNKPINSASKNVSERILELHSIETGDMITNNGSVENMFNTAAQRYCNNENRSLLDRSLGKFTDDNFPAHLAFSNQISSVGRLKIEKKENSTFCVEIKPKQGWIPFIDRCNPKCTFCLTQYLKLSKGTVDGISQYCPLDLFSGNEIRMKKSLKSLLSTPQNNLKIFKDGHLVYSDDVKTDLMSILKEWFEASSNTMSNDLTLDDSDRLVTMFCSLVYQALTKDLTRGEFPPTVEDLPGADPFNDEDDNILPASPLITSASLLSFSQACDWSSQLLPSNCILDRILKIQQLQHFGVDAVYQMYRNLDAEETDFNYVKRLCSQTSNKLLLDPVQRYLLATTAKDCSILIAFQKTTKQDIYSCDERELRDIDGTSYVWNIGVSDLDPKPLSCIEKHRKRDMDVISSCIEFLKDL